MRDSIAPVVLLASAVAIVAPGLAERWRAVDHRHHDGRVIAAATVVTGPLRAELRAAEYERGVARVAGGRSDLRLPREPAARLDLRLHNDGADPLTIPTGMAGGAATPGACYALVDDAGRRCPALAADWNPRRGEPERDAGRLLPGWGAAIIVHFPGIRTDARALTLQLGCVAAGGVTFGPLHLAVPLP